MPKSTQTSWSQTFQGQSWDSVTNIIFCITSSIYLQIFYNTSYIWILNLNRRQINDHVEWSIYFLLIILTSTSCRLYFTIVTWSEKVRPLKLYCSYKYTMPCVINRIWGLKQLWLQVNDHAWFHLHGSRWAVQNGERAKNSKWKYVSSRIRTHTTPLHDR